MKLTQHAIAAIAMLTLIFGGQALAGEAHDGSSSTIKAEAPHNDTAAESPTALPAEAPWISLALHNGKDIGLSDAQTRKLEKLRADFQQVSTRRMEAIAKAERKLSQLLQVLPVKLALVRGQVDRIGDLRDDLRKQRIETLLEGRTELNAGQKEKLQELVARSAVQRHNAIMERNHGPAIPPRGMM